MITGGGADLEGGPFQVGQRLDVFDEYPTKRCWTEARVIEVHEDRIRVHFAVRTALWLRAALEGTHALGCSLAGIHEQVR